MRLDWQFCWFTVLAWISARAVTTRIERAPVSSNPSANEVTATTDPANFSDVYCPAVNGISWTLFRDNCYHRYSARFGITGTSPEELKNDYKTWFEAREECAKLRAKLASVHDQATQETLLELVADNENVTSLQETTWIGLQVGTSHSGCYWPVGVRPRLAGGDPCPGNAVEECNVTYNDTFHGQWEDGKLYDEAESAVFWGADEPTDFEKQDCNGREIKADDQSRAYCERGVNGEPDRRRHCAQVLPVDEKQIDNGMPQIKRRAGKWIAYWCWMKNRAYICERPAKPSDEPEDSTGPSLTSGGVESTTRLDNCTDCALERADEIEREINATQIGYSVVIEPMALEDAAVGTTWLGGSAPLADLAQSAIDFGRSIAKLSAEDCIPESRGLRQQLKALSKKMEESYKKVETELAASAKIFRGIVKGARFQKSYDRYRTAVQFRLASTYKLAVQMLARERNTGTYRKQLMTYCTGEQTPENLIMKMQAYLTPAEPTHEATEGLYANMLSELLEHEPDSKTKVQLLMVEVDAVARMALTSLGVCAQALHASTREQDKSSKKATQALSNVNNAFKGALQNNTLPTPYAEYVVAAMNLTAKEVLVKANFGSQGWSAREPLHKAIVNETVSRLESNMSYVFNAVASLPDDRDDRQCRQFPKDSMVDVSDRNVFFFVLYANSSSRNASDKAWDNLKDSKDAVLSHVFAKSSENLSERLDAALSGQKINKDNFRGGIAAVKCGYEFVWYELGYTYFYAAYSSTDYKWEKKGGAYDAECGQIFLFP